MMNWTIGIDVGASGIHYQIQTRDGTRVASGQAVKSATGWSSFRDLYAAKGLVPGQTLVVIEATGRHHLPWCERLHEAGFTVHALNPLLSKRLYSSRNAIRDNKDDRTDADTLAEIGRLHAADLERFAYRPQAGRLRVQSLVSARKAVRTQCTNLIKSADDLYQLAFPELADCQLKLTHAGLRRLLLEAPTPAAFAQLSDQALRKAFATKAPAVREALRQRITPDEVAGACSEALVRLIQTIEALLCQIKELEKAIEEAIAQDETDRETQRLIRTLPGFGEVTAAVITAFLPREIFACGTKKQITAKLQAYFGFDPRRRQSGKHEGKVKISKRSIEIVRTAFYQASACGIRHDPQLRRYYDKKKAEGDHHKKAVVDLMRKNLRRLVSVLANRQPYLPMPENA